MSIVQETSKTSKKNIFLFLFSLYPFYLQAFPDKMRSTELPA